MPVHEDVSSAARSRVSTRTARPDDLAAVLGLVRQHQADAGYERVLTGQTPGGAVAAGFRQLLEDPGHRVVLAVAPAPLPAAGGTGAIGLAVLGTDPLPAVLGTPRVTIDWFVVHRDHRRRGTGVALLAAAAGYAAETGADHVVAAVTGSDAERQRFFSRMGFAPLATRRIVGREQLTRRLAAWQRTGLAVPVPRRPAPRRPVRLLTDLAAVEG
ncbi:GNAT family N-acetyltransferase [Modestobacter altitudinis]|uniref:GNAT family N-acetyltransferase n=1 Tax=Modestobacter altitudinis TaxID=2213158 RepID=UPI00148664BA|nr:GNAT family N-acetyltransferase [Modestobacter altitudinis]